MRRIHDRQKDDALIDDQVLFICTLPVKFNTPQMFLDYELDNTLSFACSSSYYFEVLGVLTLIFICMFSY